MPAVNLVVNASLVIPVEERWEVLKSIGKHIPLLASAEPVKEEIMLVPDEIYTTLFESLRRKDAFALSYVTFELVYRNLVGACFAVRQAYYVVAPDDIDAELKAWHAAISSFGATYQEELMAMPKKTAPRGAFERIKQNFAEKVGKKKHLPLKLAPIAGAFEARAITKENYDTFLKTVGLPRLTFAHTVCPINSDSDRRVDE